MLPYMEEQAWDKTLSQQWLKNVRHGFCTTRHKYVSWYLLLIRIKLGNMSYYKNRGTTGTNRTLISNRQAIQGKKLGLFNCYCPKHWLSTTKMPTNKKQWHSPQTWTNRDCYVCNTRLKNGLKGAMTQRHNQLYRIQPQHKTAVLPFPPILKFPDFYGRTNSIKYNSIITLEAQIYQNILSMTHPTISNTNHSVSSKTSTTTQSRLCKIGVCPWHTTNCVKHKSDAHASTHVCVQNIEKIQPVNVSSIRWFSNQSKLTKSGSKIQRMFHGIFFFQRSKYNWIILFWKQLGMT